ncbi:MAG: YidC/Oxa1 family membrane protein insertase [Treponema sp.]|jgi:YidC/Oxa1 family membrane protein insertase|nr:YidC/Oxa1 family membrane protein insertase [Treponema sp.]
MPNILYTIIIYPITQILEFVFVFAQKLFRETGLSIICVSGAVSVLCLPLYMVAEKWQEVERNIQKQLAPKIAKIKAAFSGDERYMILSAYYRQNHYHPIYAMRSTFGLLIQIPFFIAAYSYLSHLDALQGASFFFIRDLGKPDALIPIAGGINFLPVLMTLINCTAGAVYTKGLEIKDKVQLYGMSLVFLLLLYNSPSGLVLYWTLNNVFSLVKNIYLKINISNTIKTTIVNVFISLICFLLVLYILFVNQGVLWTRIIAACGFGIIGSLPWLLILIKRIANKIPCRFYSVKEQLAIFLPCVVSLWILTGFFIPSMLVGASSQEFSFIDAYTTPLYFIFNTALQSFGFCLFWMVMLFFLFSEKTKKIFTALCVILVYSALVNAFLFHGNYGIISINLVFSAFVSHNIKETALNLLLLFVLSCILAALFIAGRKKICIFLGTVPALALAIFSTINLISINNEYQELALYYKPEQASVQEIKPIFHLSKTGKNVVVIMLDRGTSVFIPYIFEESPELYEKYSGFIYYPNTVSFAGYTKDGAPPLFGGYEYTPLEINKRDSITITEKHNEALLMMPRIFADSGFDVTVTHPPYAGGYWKSDLRIYDKYPDIKPYITAAVYTDLWLKEHNVNLPSTSVVLKRNILWYSLLRSIPLALRQSIYNDGDWCAPFADRAMRITISAYSVLDYLSKLTDFEPQKENAAVFFVNETSHRDTFLQAPDYIPVLSPTNYGTSPFAKEMAYHTNAAAIKRLADWFDLLKSEGVYDNTKIILVADHGPAMNFITKIGLPFNVDEYNPLLMVKDFYADGIMETNSAFMTNADVPSIALKGIIDNPHNPFTGNEINMESKNKPQYIAIGRIANQSDTQLNLRSERDYYVHENIFKIENWTPANK